MARTKKTVRKSTNAFQPQGRRGVVHHPSAPTGLPPRRQAVPLNRTISKKGACPASVGQTAKEFVEKGRQQLEKVHAEKNAIMDNLQETVDNMSEELQSLKTGNLNLKNEVRKLKEDRTI